MSNTANVGLENDQLPLNFTTPTKTKATAPRWSGGTVNKITWCVWYLTQNPHLTRKFFELADVERLAGCAFSGEQIVNKMRWNTDVHATNDEFAVSSNAKSLYPRLYLHQYPDAKVKIKPCWLDELTALEWQIIFEAWQAANGSST